MKRLQIEALIMGIVAIALITAACNKGAQSSPTATFKTFYEVSKNKDAAAARKLFSKATMEIFEMQAKERNKTVEEMFKTGMEEKPMPDKMPELRNEKINGNDATLEVKDEKTGKWDALTFVKEDGQWKIALEKMGPPTPAGN